MGLLDSSSFRNFFFKKRWISVPLLGPLLQLRPRQPLLFEAVRANGRLFWKFLVKKVPLLFTWRNVIFFLRIFAFSITTYYYWSWHDIITEGKYANAMSIWWYYFVNWKFDVLHRIEKLIFIFFSHARKPQINFSRPLHVIFFLFLHKIFCLSLATCIV